MCVQNWDRSVVANFQVRRGISVCCLILMLCGGVCCVVELSFVLMSGEAVLGVT